MSDPRLTLVPDDDSEPLVDTERGEAHIAKMTKVRASHAISTTRYYRFEVGIEDVPADQRPDIPEGARLDMVYSAGVESVSLYGETPDGDDGAVAVVEAFLDSKRPRTWVIKTQTLQKDNEIEDVHEVSEP